MESKPQMKHFVTFAIDFPKNRVGQVHLGPPANYGSVINRRVVEYITSLLFCHNSSISRYCIIIILAIESITFDLLALSYEDFW